MDAYCWNSIKESIKVHCQNSVIHQMKLLLTVASICAFTIASTQPCPRNQPVVAYYPALQSMVLFGGYCSVSKSRLNDFWYIKDGEWIEIETENLPEARSGHSMVYDSKNGQLILFGGKNDQGEFLNDTWIFKDEEWKKIGDSGPDARQSHRIVETKQGVLLFGGSNSSGESLSDTWLLIDDQWKKIEAVNPPARRQHTLVYDENRNQVVLFGGFDRIDGQKTLFGDTWEFDGKSWSKIEDNSELARDHHGMAYNPLEKKVYLFGGYNSDYLGDIRSWDGTEWELINDSGPSRAGKPALYFDPIKKALVLFGGGDQSNMRLMDFWLFDSNSMVWKEQ